jgi:hypothetical protein
VAIKFQNTKVATGDCNAAAAISLSTSCTYDTKRSIEDLSQVLQDLKTNVCVCVCVRALWCNTTQQTRDIILQRNAAFISSNLLHLKSNEMPLPSAFSLCRSSRKTDVSLIQIQGIYFSCYFRLAYEIAFCYMNISLCFAYFTLVFLLTSWNVKTENFFLTSIWAFTHAGTSWRNTRKEATWVA